MTIRTTEPCVQLYTANFLGVDEIKVYYYHHDKFVILIGLKKRQRMEDCLQSPIMHSALRPRDPPMLFTNLNSGIIIDIIIILSIELYYM